MPQPISKVPLKHRIDEEAKWLTTEEMCQLLGICRSTLYRVRTFDGLMAEGVHFVRKNPASIRCGHLLWNPAEVEKAFGRCLP
jgi:predicted DNA-binding transcriptional regulator AlpA